uniref:Uncharacterized protein n=1 Tax=Arundo donax TaxID=35708 RepID=A0A0A9C3L1_ARUDO
MLTGFTLHFCCIEYRTVILSISTCLCRNSIWLAVDCMKIAEFRTPITTHILEHFNKVRSLYT